MYYIFWGVIAMIGVGYQIPEVLQGSLIESCIAGFGTGCAISYFILGAKEL